VLANIPDNRVDNSFYPNNIDKLIDTTPPKIHIDIDNLTATQFYSKTYVTAMKKINKRPTLV